ncbi:hypothetical protein GP486_005881 [Trichoglossum hirsutum]|uniref:Uncharacterized protein n=1 Tax=Trichoglossum hirsutum TaxID=265104 RepID=A0A9P8RLF2_9PEZI|nr:hypothetical protein GP486_005881 [Trichoglossum hirsutum]
MVEEDTGPTRQSRRERVPTTKAAEQEKMGTTIGREWEDSDEDSMGDVIEAQMDVPKAPRPARRQYQLGTPSFLLLVRRKEKGKLEMVDCYFVRLLWFYDGASPSIDQAGEKEKR